jgi:hypothetical protein
MKFVGPTPVEPIEARAGLSHDRSVGDKSPIPDLDRVNQRMGSGAISAFFFSPNLAISLSSRSEKKKPPQHWGLWELQSKAMT